MQDTFFTYTLGFLILVLLGWILWRRHVPTSVTPFHLPAPRNNEYYYSPCRQWRRPPFCLFCKQELTTVVVTRLIGQCFYGVETANPHNCAAVTLGKFFYCKDCNQTYVKRPLWSDNLYEEI